jgi:hypothetical protein
MGSRRTRLHRAAAAAALLLSLTTSAAAVSRCPGDCDGDDVVAVDELIAGVRAVLAPGTGRACDAADADGDGTITVNGARRRGAAALDGCPFERVPFTATVADGALELTPATALRGDAVYAVVLTSAVRAAGGATPRPAPDFAAARGVPATEGAGPVASTATSQCRRQSLSGWTARRRRRRDDPRPHRPARPADSPKLAQARGVLRDTACGRRRRRVQHHAPIRIALSAPVDLATVDADSVLLIRRRDRGLALEPLLDALEHAGTPRAAVALAVCSPPSTSRTICWRRGCGSTSAARRCARPSSTPIPPTRCRSGCSRAAPARTPTSLPPTRPSPPSPAASTRRRTSAPPTACSIAPC